MILVAVCDGTKALLFKKKEKYSDLEYLKTISFHLELNHEHGRDKPGRGEGISKFHHAYESQTDWHERQKEKFMKNFTEEVIEYHKEHNIQKIYFACPSKLAGTFRNTLHHQIDTLHKNNLEIHEIHKDFTHLTVKEINDFIMKYV